MDKKELLFFERKNDIVIHRDGAYLLEREN